MDDFFKDKLHNNEVHGWIELLNIIMIQSHLHFFVGKFISCMILQEMFAGVNDDLLNFNPRSYPLFNHQVSEIVSKVLRCQIHCN